MEEASGDQLERFQEAAEVGDDQIGELWLEWWKMEEMMQVSEIEMFVGDF